MAKNPKISFMSRTTITVKFKMFLFSNEASYWAEKVLTDINLPPLMRDEDNNFGGSLVWILESDDFTCNPATQEYP